VILIFTRCIEAHCCFWYRLTISFSDSFDRSTFWVALTSFLLFACFHCCSQYLASIWSHGVSLLMIVVSQDMFHSWRSHCVSRFDYVIGHRTGYTISGYESLLLASMSFDYRAFRLDFRYYFWRDVERAAFMQNGKIGAIKSVFHYAITLRHSIIVSVKGSLKELPIDAALTMFFASVCCFGAFCGGTVLYGTLYSCEFRFRVNLRQLSIQSVLSGLTSVQSDWHFRTISFIK